MDARRRDNLLQERVATDRPYVEFLRSGSLSVGLYVLAAGETDHQRPHLKDEVSVAMEGRARFTAGGEKRDVSPGDVIFVAAQVPHRSTTSSPTWS